MRRSIERRFDEWIKWKFKKKDIQKFLLTHERREICIQNLMKEVQTAAYKNPKFNTKQLAYVIDTVARMFATAAIDNRHQSVMSDAEKQRMRKESSKINDYEEQQKELRKEFKIDDTANDKSL